MSPSSPAPATSARIALLSPLVVDQIAAGEVVERPASVVKELVDNAIDAGSSRVDVELEEGGLTLIAVRDNGRGIHPDDLLLAVTRHATSKLRDPSELSEIGTLGFRGEALASVAAVARLDLRSRQQGAAVGNHLHARPGEPPRMVPAGLPVGTQVEVRGLFANLPARRKFMRAEATEVGHCSEVLLRLAIVHPDVHFTLRHGRRELLNLPRGTLDERVAQVLGRRVAGPLFGFIGEEDDTRVQVWLPTPEAAGRGRGGPYLVVRERVVRERSLAQIIAQAYGLSGEASACMIVEPPRASVDVNVHPQKSEIRFSDPQRVYAAVRRVLAAAMRAAPWAGALAEAREETREEAPMMRPSAPPRSFAQMATPMQATGAMRAEEATGAMRVEEAEGASRAEGARPEGAPRAEGARPEGAMQAEGARPEGAMQAERARPEETGAGFEEGAWRVDEAAEEAFREMSSGTGPDAGDGGSFNNNNNYNNEMSSGTGSEGTRGAGYRLSTRALGAGYGEHKRGVMAEAAALRPASEPPMLQGEREVASGAGRGGSRELMALREDERPGPAALFAADLMATPMREGQAQGEEARGEAPGPTRAVPQLLTCLPGPVALFADREALLAVDLRRLRSHLVYLRLQRDLIGKRVVAVQGLLAPVVVRRPVEEVGIIAAARADLLQLGVDLDGFGEDAVVVRGVPAHLRHCVDDADVADLIARVVPWLRMRTRESDASAMARGLLGAIAATRGADPAPRLARRWLAELVEGGATLAEVPGVRRWTAAALLGEAGTRRAITLGHDDGAAV